MNTDEILSGSSFLPHQKPRKLIFMLHGYGDTAENFINIASSLNQPEWKANYIALNAPFSIPNYPQGRQWFDLYPNGIYISEAGVKEIEIISLEVLKSVKLIENTIKKNKDKYGIFYKDCFLLGFSQGGMMTFEFGNYFQYILGGLAILSGRIMSEHIDLNDSLQSTPIFISHGNRDKVLPIKAFDLACKYLQKNKLLFEHHALEHDAHVISDEAINLLQKFIKKNL